MTATVNGVEFRMQVRTCKTPGGSAASEASRSNQNSRSAFTLVELLVVIAIIAMLVSLLLPAVQQAREAGRRINCLNHTRQIALAILNYETANSKLPPPGYAGVNRDPSLRFGDFVPHFGKQISWIVLTLPFMEEQSLYDQFDLSQSVFDQQGNPAGAQPPSLFCPSDGAEGRYLQSAETQNVPIGKGNYAAWASPFHVDLQSVWPGALGSWGLKLKEAEDGMSKTFMISEVRTRADVTDQRGAWAVPWNASSLLAYDAHHDLTRGMRFAPDVTGSGGLTGAEKMSFMQRPNHAGPNLDPIYECSDPQGAQLEGMPCGKFSLGNDNVAYLSSAPRSSHPGGVNVAMMDGSGKFVPDDIDPVSMAYQVSVSDGQTPDPDQ